MNGLKTYALIIALLFLGFFPCSSEDQIAEIVYLEDDVEIVRNSEMIYPEEIFIGMGIDNYDCLSTNESGYAEIDITSPGSTNTMLKVSPNTTFYFEINKFGRDKKTTVGMIGGSISLKVKKITGSRDVEVRTESATMGVRGTSFDVRISPSGDTLVTCEEGKVSCRDDEGAELISEPGRVVEKIPGELFREIPVAVSDLEKFHKEWYAERLEVFKANALKAIKTYASYYFEFKDDFRSAYQELRKEQKTLNKWYEEDREGTTGSKIELMREKKRIIGHLFKLRKILFLFERVYFRLVELEDYYKQGYGRGMVRPGLTTADFFMRFNTDKKELGEKMAHVRYIVKLYSKRNEGNFPLDLLDQDESDFFGEDTDFFF